MTVTPQTNTTLSEIASALAERDHFVIGGHVSPDGDCLGSALGLAWALRQLGKQVACVLARDEEPPSDLMFLPGADGLVPAAGFEGPCDVLHRRGRAHAGATRRRGAPARGGALHRYGGSSRRAAGHERPQLHGSGRRLHVTAYLGAGVAFGRRSRAPHRHLLLHRSYDRHRPFPARQHRRCRVQGGVRNGRRRRAARGYRPGVLSEPQSRLYRAGGAHGGPYEPVRRRRGGALVALARRFRRVRGREGRCRAA